MPLASPSEPLSLPTVDVIDTHGTPPPRSLWGILGQLGPGLIIAGSIVGSGELVATTKTGAQAGICLLWLIVAGCLIKVFVQIELGRFTISEGIPTLRALNSVPGPRLGVNWLIWFWAIMMVASMGQLGGIVGGVGQSLAIAIPISGDYAHAIAAPSNRELKRYLEHTAKRERGEPLGANPEEESRAERGHELIVQQLAALGERGTTLVARVKRGEKVIDPVTNDDRIWASVIGVLTAVLLFVGRYNLIQTLSTVLVVAFTFVTVGNVVALQQTADYHLPLDEILRGFRFGLPSNAEGLNPLTTALATFGIIGVGATELIAYPYWCLEKGYARAVGVRNSTNEWATRARGWIRVMQLDALASMVVYTLATVAFYLMGVAVLYREGRDPDDMRMVSTLATAYVPIFGEYARWLFLFGAFAVLYSTYLVASAGHSRTVIDAATLFGLHSRPDRSGQPAALKWVSGIFPLICLAMFLSGANPVSLILLSGILQAMMLPMLAGAALYFRYTRTDRRLVAGPLWDVCLFASALGMLVAGCWGVYSRIYGG